MRGVLVDEGQLVQQVTFPMPKQIKDCVVSRAVGNGNSKLLTPLLRAQYRLDMDNRGLLYPVRQPDLLLLQFAYAVSWGCRSDSEATIFS